jgi:hypothetical protein
MAENEVQKRDIFRDPALETAAQDDPVVRFLVQNWRSLVAVLVAGGLAFFGYNSFSSTAELRRAGVSASLVAIQKEYGELVKKQERSDSLKRQLEADQASAVATAVPSVAPGAVKEKKAADKSSDAEKSPELTAEQRAERVRSGKEQLDRLQKELDEGRNRLVAMTDALKGQPPFDTLGRLYQGLVAVRFADFDQARQVLEASSWRAVSATDSPERVTAEFVTLAIARGLLDSERFSAAGSEALVQLAREGSYAAVQAAVAYARAAVTPEERATARELLDRAGQRFPAQQKFIAAARELVAG